MEIANLGSVKVSAANLANEVAALKANHATEVEELLHRRMSDLNQAALKAAHENIKVVDALRANHTQEIDALKANNENLKAEHTRAANAAGSLKKTVATLKASHKETVTALEAEYQERSAALKQDREELEAECNAL